MLGYKGAQEGKDFQDILKQFPSLKSKRTLLSINEYGNSFNNYFIKLSEKNLFRFLLCCVYKDKVNYKDIKIDEKKYKIECTIIDYHGDVRASMEILKYDDNTNTIEFQRLQGNLLTYYNKIKTLKSSFLDPLAKDYKP